MQLIVPLVIVALVLVFRMRRLSQGRRLRLEWLWVTPLIVVLAASAAVASAPPDVYGWGWLALAFVLGGALGWTRGRMMHIDVDPETHALNARASPIAIVFILALVLLRMGMRTLAFQEAGALKLDLRLITDLFAVFAVGLIGLQRLEMWLRGQRLLSEARAARAAA
jgi:hypothetical protein